MTQYGAECLGCYSKSTSSFIRITSRFEQKLGEISLEDVKKEGYSSLEEFRRAWENIYGPGSWDPEQTVTVYEFELARDSNP